MDSLQIQHGQLDSLEELSTAVAPVGWNVNFCQLERGRGGVLIDIVGTSNSLLMRTALQSRAHQQAAPPPGTVTWALLTEQQAPFKFGKRSVETNSLVCLHPELGLDGVNEGGFSAYTISFSAERISDIAATAGVPDPSFSQAAWGIPRYVDSGALASIRHLVQMIFEKAQLSEASEDMNLRQLLESELALQLLTTPTSAESGPSDRLSNRNRALLRAVEYIQDNPKALHTMEQLCRYSACSLSTLERAFREYYGVSPKQYMTALRLSGARMDLLNPEEKRGVGNVATEWGFWHLSKFAADYKRMFGELPSTTHLATFGCPSSKE